MPNKDHDIAITLNEDVLSLMRDLNIYYSDDTELPEVIRQLERVSQYLVKKQLKTFEDENNKI